MLDLVTVNELQLAHEFLAKLHYLYLHFLPNLINFGLKHFQHLLRTHLIPHPHQHLPYVAALYLLYIGLAHIVDERDLGWT